ncbi:endonuclease V [Geodermatophilus sp. YIM 151500]|uniref:endonuclease V n=1 Tax=Geodermatophilus sp. YIM 151500 TaxID=2984531 RepID=UPI0021E42DEB|nr:endonuclease V [Geodermatophilus sp. YIM 151500]MCV2489348.1 endonuclease V [Geodermatophilus sp. YIM 151500]
MTPEAHPRGAGALWSADPAAARAEQRRLAALAPPTWQPGPPPWTVAGVALTAGPADHEGRDPVRAAAVLLRGSEVLATRVEEAVAPAPYVAGLQGVREGPLLAVAVRGLGRRPDVLLVAAAGRDHPRRAGLALQLGAVLDVPTVGVTDRPLAARGPQPGPGRGSTAPLLLDGADVARWVRTATGVRPVVASAAWRTTAGVAAAVVLATSSGARTPEPLREARRLARTAGHGTAGQRAAGARLTR